MNKATNYTMGFLSGAMVGSVITLLYAPENGSNIRDIISYRVSSYMDDLNRLIEQLINEREITSDAKKQRDKVVQDARQRAENLIKEAEKLLHSIEETKKNTANGGES
jgi:gas vesicle protein